MLANFIPVEEDPNEPPSVSGVAAYAVPREPRPCGCTAPKAPPGAALPKAPPVAGGEAPKGEDACGWAPNALPPAGLDPNAALLA